VRPAPASPSRRSLRRTHRREQRAQLIEQVLAAIDPFDAALQELAA